MTEHDEEAQQLEREAQDLEEQSDRVGERIDETRRDWESKEQDPSVPGAQPDRDAEEESVPGVATDEERLSEEGGP
jgi:hypothetical protein